MERETLMQFKNLFENQKTEILRKLNAVQAEIKIEKDDMLDETDLTSTHLQQQMELRLRGRENLLLRKIDEALARIHSGSFGECEDCGDAIAIKRLEARPTTTFCISCKELQENREAHFMTA